MAPYVLRVRCRGEVDETVSSPLARYLTFAAAARYIADWLFANAPGREVALSITLATRMAGHMLHHLVWSEAPVRSVWYANSSVEALEGMLEAMGIAVHQTSEPDGGDVDHIFELCADDDTYFADQDIHVLPLVAFDPFPTTSALHGVHLAIDNDLDEAKALPTVTSKVDAVKYTSRGYRPTGVDRTTSMRRGVDVHKLVELHAEGKADDILELLNAGDPFVKDCFASFLAARLKMAAQGFELALKEQKLVKNGLRGRVDAVYSRKVAFSGRVSRQVFRVVDYKTTSAARDNYDPSKALHQVATYVEMVKRTLKTEDVDGVVLVLRRESFEIIPVPAAP